MATPPKKRQVERRPTLETYEEFVANSGIMELAMRLRVLEAQRQALGLAPHDRELLRCPQCGLFEGADDEGVLFTSLKRHSRHDTGLRFEKLTDGRWFCPFCAAKVVEPAFEPPPGFWDT